MIFRLQDRDKFLCLFFFSFLSHSPFKFIKLLLSIRSQTKRRTIFSYNFCVQKFFFCMLTYKTRNQNVKKTIIKINRETTSRRLIVLKFYIFHIKKYFSSTRLKRKSGSFFGKNFTYINEWNLVEEIQKSHKKSILIEIDIKFNQLKKFTSGTFAKSYRELRQVFFAVHKTFTFNKIKRYRKFKEI